MKAVISQPTYLPWAGYFGMIDIADVFVFYDDVQFERRSWQSRNRIKQAGESWMWLSVPVVHNGREERINEVRIDNSSSWRERHWKSLLHSYSRSSCFNGFRDSIEEIYRTEWEYICDLNIAVIEKLTGMLGISRPEFIKSSSLAGVLGQKTDRLLNVIDKIGADEYISGEGTRAYLETDKFKEKGISLYWFEYKHPVYPQNGTGFIPFMSAVDLLFNTGVDAARYIREGLNGALVKVG